MQVRVLERDRQAQPGAARGAGARRVGPPEAIEDVLHLLLRHADAVVPHDDRDRAVVLRDGHLDRALLGVLDGVDHEVAQDALDPARVEVGRGVGVGQPHGDPDVLGLRERGGLLHHGHDQVAQVTALGVEHGCTGVEPADLQQVRQERLEPVDLAEEQLGGAAGVRVQLVARLVDDLARHADSRQRRAQLVRDVGDEPALHGGELLHAPDLVLQALGHLVERPRQARHLVGAPRTRHALGEVPLGEPLGHGGCPGHRGHRLPGHGPGDDAEQRQHAEPAREQHAVHERQGLLLRLQRVEVVDLEARTRRGLHGRAHDDARPDHTRVVDRRDAHRLQHLVVLGGDVRLAQLVGDDHVPQVAPGHDVGHLRGAAGLLQQEVVHRGGAAGGGERRDGVVQQALQLAVRRRRGVREVLRDLRRQCGGLPVDRREPLLVDPVPHRRRQVQPQHRDGREADRQRRGDDPQLQRGAPLRDPAPGGPDRDHPGP